MQMHSVETSAGTAIWRAPSRIAGTTSVLCAQVAVDIFDFDSASSTRIPTASASPPSVMMLMVSPSALMTHDGSQNRKRNRNRDDHRAAPASQEQQNHGRGKAGGDDGFANHSADGRADEHRLVGDGFDLQLRRQRGGDVRQRVAHLFDDFERGGLPHLHHLHQHAALAVAADDVGLRRKAVADVGHVADVDGGVADGLDGQIVDLRRRAPGLLLRSTSYSNCPIFEVPEGRIRFCWLTALTTSAGEIPLACIRSWPDVDHHLALFAAVG